MRCTLRPPLPTPPVRGRRTAFTLIELMIAVVIMGIMVMIGTKGLTRFINQSKITRAHQALTNSIQSAFPIAARDHKPIRLVWNPARVTFLITDRTQTQVYRTLGLGSTSGYSFRASDVVVYPTTNFVEVFPNGLATDSFTVRLTKNGYSKSVLMTRAGLVLSR
jgi:prepilin-type N-terminal cleavage/methylation domain-containing protein